MYTNDSDLEICAFEKPRCSFASARLYWWDKASCSSSVFLSLCSLRLRNSSDSSEVCIPTSAEGTNFCSEGWLIIFLLFPFPCCLCFRNLQMLYSSIWQWLIFYEYQTATHKEVRNSNLTGYKTITDSSYLLITIQRPVQNWLMGLCIHKIHTYFCHRSQVCARFGDGGMDCSSLRILLMTSFL